MKGTSTAAAFLAIFIVSSAADSDIDCQGKPDGTAIRDPDDCSIWYSCVGNAPEMRVCFVDTLFDTKSRSCQAPELVTSCENKPDSFHDPCPAISGIERMKYPSGNPDNLAFYVLCKNRKFMGYRRSIRIDGKEHPDQRYFKRCSELKGRVRVLFVEHPEYYFLCVDGIHSKTKKITPEVKDRIVRPEDLPKPKWRIAMESAAAAKAKEIQDEIDREAAIAKLKKEQEDNDAAAAASAAAATAAAAASAAAASAAASAAAATKYQEEKDAATAASIATAKMEQDRKDAAQKAPKLLAAAAKARSLVREKVGDFVVAARGVVEKNRRHNEAVKVDETTREKEKDRNRIEMNTPSNTESFTDAARDFEEVRNLRMVASSGSGVEQKPPTDVHAVEKNATQSKLKATTEVARRLLAEADEAKIVVKEKIDEFEVTARRLGEERRQRKEAFKARKEIGGRSLVAKVATAQKLSSEAAEITRLARDKMQAAALAPIGEEQIRLRKEAEEANIKADEADMAAKVAEVQVKSEIAAEAENLAKNKRDEHAAATRGFDTERRLRKRAFETGRRAGEKDLIAKGGEVDILSAKAAVAKILAKEKNEQFRAATVEKVKENLRIEAEEADKMASEASLAAKTAKTQLYSAVAMETKRLAKDKQAEFEAATHGFEEERRLLKETFEHDRQARVLQLEVQMREARGLSANALRLKRLAKEKRDAINTAVSAADKAILREEADKAFAETREALLIADAATKRVRLAKATEAKIQAEENVQIFFEMKRIVKEERDLQKEVFDEDRKVAEKDLESKSEEVLRLSAEVALAKSLAKEKRDAFNAAAPGDKKNALQREADEADQRASEMSVAAEIAKIQQLSAEAALAKSLAKEKKDTFETTLRYIGEADRLWKELREISRKANEVDLVIKRTDAQTLSAKAETAKRQAKEKRDAFDAAAPGDEKENLGKDAEQAELAAGSAVVAAKAAESQTVSAQIAEEKRLADENADSSALAKRSIEEERKLRNEADEAESKANELDIIAKAANAQRLSTAADVAKRQVKEKRDAFNAAAPGDEKERLGKDAEQAELAAGSADVAAKAAESQKLAAEIDEAARLARVETERISMETAAVPTETKENADAIRRFDEELRPSLNAEEREREIREKNIAVKFAEREQAHAEAKKLMELLEEQKNQLLREPIGSPEERKLRMELDESTKKSHEVSERFRVADLAAKAAELENLTAEAEIARTYLKRTKNLLVRALPGSEEQLRLSTEVEDARKNARKAVDALVAYGVRSADLQNVVL